MQCRAPPPPPRAAAGGAELSKTTSAVPAGTALASRRRLPAAPVRASFFGVGAPEAILVGVVALVVFGPKGLAQVRVCVCLKRCWGRCWGQAIDPP